MQNNKIVLIGGAKAAGKSVLRAMLDGHSRCFASPFHELFPETLMLGYMTEKPWKGPLLALLKQRGNYDQLEKYFSSGKILADLGGGNIETITLTSDFQLFTDFIKELGTISSYSPVELEELSLSVYDKLASIIFPHNFSQFQYFCTMTTGYPNRLTKLLTTFPNALYIGMQREIKEILAALYIRDHTEGEFDRYINEKFICELILYQNEQNRLLAQFPEKVKIFKFDEFFLDLNTNCVEIFDFLDLKIEKTSYIYSFLGNETKSVSSDKLFSAPIDKADDIFSNKEKKNVESLIENCKRICYGKF
jgi:hypothetical protein